MLWTAIAIFFGSFALLPFIGKEFQPQVDESFISLRLNTPVGTSLEFTDSKVHEVEALLKQFPEIVLAMTTVGNAWDGRNYARINLKLTDRTERARSQKDLERAIRQSLRPIPGIELALDHFVTGLRDQLRRRRWAHWLVLPLAGRCGAGAQRSRGGCPIRGRSARPL